MTNTLQLSTLGPVTLEWALAEERNVIKLATYEPAVNRFVQDLWSQKVTLEKLVRYHMNLGMRYECTVLPPQNWIQGGFNVCVLAEVSSLAGKKTSQIILRCPMPHKLAEARYPGTIDEKMGCEVGAYAWVQDKCPEIPIPHLFGFGLSNGQHFTHSKNMPLLARIVRRCWRLVYSLFRLPLLSEYIQSYPDCNLTSAYMLLEYLGPDTGRMLSNTFDAERGDLEKRQRLFKGISRIILSLAKIPQSRIGSFCFNNNGIVTLTNRPLCCSTMILENDTGARSMQRSNTYTCTDAYVSDMLDLHDQRFLSEPNAVQDEQDCYFQISIKTLLRLYSHSFIQKKNSDKVHSSFS